MVPMFLSTVPDTSGIDGILGSITSLVTSGVAWIKSFVGVITGNPLILLFVIVSFVGLGVGLIRRLIRL